MSEDVEARIEELLQQMTIEEKASLGAGADMWHSVGVERLGIPGIKCTDGPNGARGGQWQGGLTAACFPAGVSLGATWNTALVEQIGQALGQEARSKQAHVLLAPTVNIHRTAVGGRNFECYSEDPYLTARMAVAYIKGVQSQGVGACIKHFVANDSEYERHTISSEVRERVLREIYLPPFEAAVKEAKVWAVMGAYNKVNGTYCCEHPYLLRQLLKEEWGFDGIVISDWTATHSTVEAANAGLDLEMPGPAKFFGARLAEAVRAGQVSEEVVTDIARRMLRLMFRTGAFNHPEGPEQAIDRPEHRQLIRRAAAEGIVLLKNEGNALPLSTEGIRKLAVIGPNAKTARIMGGGSARVNPHYVVTPLEGLKARCGDAVEILYALGCTNHKTIPPVEAEWLAVDAEAAPGSGLKLEFFNNLDLEGEPAHTQTTTGTHFMWFGDFAPGVNPQAFSARLSGYVVAPTSGRYTFSLTSAGLSRLYIDGQEIVDNWTAQQPGDSFFSSGSAEVTGTVELEAGKRYAIEVRYTRRRARFVSGLTVGCLPPMPEDPIAEAEAIAREADAAIVFVGTNDEWESEGYDRQDITLPGRQDELVARVAAANPRTIVVVQSGGPVTMPWIDQVPAALEAWFPGQECGNAIADVLFGDVNPSGRLPTTFPRRLEDTPAYINYPGELGKVHYGEGIFVGYRYYDKKKVEPLFPFGHGLSYTAFEYGPLTLSATSYGPDQPIEIALDVSNVGDRAGQEVVQLYVRDVTATVMRPEKELKAFAKVALQPGETQTLRFTLGPEALAYYDDQARCWVAEAGEYEVLVGASSRDIRATGRFEWKETVKIGRAPMEAAAEGKRLSIATPLAELLADPRARAVLEAHVRPLVESPMAGPAASFSLEQIAQFAPDLLTEEVLQAIDQALQALN